MSIYVLRNQGPYSNGSVSIYELKEFLKTHAGTKNWTVTQSGDGLSAYSGSSDVITHSGSGANGVDNNNAWFVLTDPDGTREFCFQRSTLHYNWAILYSPSAAFSGGSSSSRATASDEEGAAKNRLTSATQLFPTSGSWYQHMVAEGDTANGNVYPFWCLCRATGTGAVGGFFMCDCVESSLSPSGDSDKMLWAATNSELNAESQAVVGGNGHFSAFMRYGEANEEWNSIQYLYYSLGTSTTVVPGNLAVNPEDGKYAMLPTFVVRKGLTVDGIKGMSNLIRYSPNSTLSYGDVSYDGTDYYLCVADIMLRYWPDSSGPSV